MGKSSSGMPLTHGTVYDVIGIEDDRYRIVDETGKEYLYLISSFVSGLKVRFMGKGSAMTLTHGKVYDVMAIERDFYRIVDETDEDYLYPIESFETVETVETALAVKA